MANFNKVLSFFLGLVVVVVFVIVLSNRLNISNKIIPFSNIKITKKVTPTPVKKTSTITQKTTKEPSEVKFTQPAVVNQQTKGGRTQIKTIPETGPATPLLIFYSSLGLFGFYLRRFKK